MVWVYISNTKSLTYAYADTFFNCGYHGSQDSKKGVCFSHVCHGRPPGRVFFGDKRDLPPINDGILISWGPINPYGLGLMSLSPKNMEIMGV